MISFAKNLFDKTTTGKQSDVSEVSPMLRSALYFLLIGHILTVDVIGLAG